MKIGFIGLGNMGGSMALNLLKAGHHLTVNDARRGAAEAQLAAGAQWANSVAELARDSELVLTSLPGPREIEAVALGANGILAGIAAHAVYADLSTNSPTLTRRIHATFAERGVAVLDAPVSGGMIGARDATLSVMVGGDRAVFDRIKPALDAIGDKVTYIGAIGAGMVAKLVHNLVGLTATQVIAEALTLGVKAGVPAEALLTALQNGAYGQGTLLRSVIPNRVMRGDFDSPSFALKLARKDVGLATELARELNVPMALGSLAEQNLLEALAQGWGDKDSTATFAVQEARAGVKVRRAS